MYVNEIIHNYSFVSGDGHFGDQRLIGTYSLTEEKRKLILKLDEFNVAKLMFYLI